RPCDPSFDETVRTLSQIFGDQTSLFNIRYQCLKWVKKDYDDFITFAGVVNRERERSKLSSMTENQFKCLIFISGLQSSQDADNRTRLLNRIEQDAEMTLQRLTTECQRLIHLKHHTAMIGQSPVTSSSCIQAVNSSVLRKSDKKPHRRQGEPLTSCCHCVEQLEGLMQAYVPIIDVKGRRLVDQATNLSITGIQCCSTPPAIKVLTPDLADPYADLIKEYKDLFQPSVFPTQLHHGVTHKILTTGNPVSLSPRRLAPDKLATAKREFEHMFELCIIRPSWASPLHMVEKTSGDWRPCGDYRAINKTTVSVKYPVPQMHDFASTWTGRLFSRNSTLSVLITRYQ
ncbi:hypothetical protein T265_15162, partial [Opisthorchis viverrini]